MLMDGGSAEVASSGDPFGVRGSATKRGSAATMVDSIVNDTD